MLTSSRILLCVALAGPTFGLAGCVVPYRVIYRLGDDPQAQQFRQVTAVTDCGVELSDGREVCLAGLSFSGVDEFYRQRFLRGDGFPMLIRQHPETSDGPILTVIVAAQHAGSPSVAMARATPPEMMIRYGTAIPLIPIYVEVPPTRVDVAEIALRQGFARLDERTVVDAERLERYRQSEAHARKNMLGIWADTDGRLFQAVEIGQVERTRHMLALGADPNAVSQTHEGKSALMLAVQSAHADVAELLLDAGAEPAECGLLETAVYQSTHGGCSGERMARLLVAHGADPAIADRGRPLQISSLVAGHARPEFVAWLVGQGAVFASRQDGARALGNAAYQGKEDVVRELARLRLDVNTRDNDGYTPLIRAMQRPGNVPNMEVIQTLLKLGADPSRPDAEGKTPLEHARHHRKPGAIRILQAAMAVPR